jgi:ABC-type amino acid transport substrate-binding protein
MKKVFAVLLAFVLVFSITSALADTLKVGELTYLNSDSVSRTAMMDKVREAAVQGGAGALFANADGLEMVEFDTLNAMQMALDAGQIDAMILYTTVGTYLSATTGNYNLSFQDRSPDPEKLADYSNPAFALTLFISDMMLGTDFSFMMREEDSALKDEFDGAITSMKEEGVLTELTALFYHEPEAVEIPVIDGAQTIKVAVTGDLPPFDYTDASGKPAGFNTAVLAEISKRIGKNIEMVSIDSAARALALTSGSVDVVFWTRVGAPDLSVYGIDPETFPDDLKALTGAISATSEGVRDTTGDIPAGMILTKPYLHDMFTLIFPKQ